MGMEEAICMEGGSNETTYAKSSVFQRTILGQVRPMLEERIRGIISGTSPPPECLTIADLGCSTGPNTLAVLRSIIDVSVSTCRTSGLRIPEFNLLMNDRPQNDFNAVFKSLSSFYKKMEEEQGVEISCFISGTPGSFYGRLFPRKSVHFMHSSTSLHFLSQVPQGVIGDGKEVVNKGSVYVNKRSPPEFLKAYQDQFGRDFTLFLRCRSEEIVDGGEVLLTLPCTNDDEPYCLSGLIDQALNKLAYEGRINKEKLEAFNLPIYMPTIQQMKHLVEAEGSFILHKIETFTMMLIASIRSSTTIDIDHPYSQSGKVIGNTLRAGLESILASEFGEEVMEALFGLIEDMVIDELATGKDFGILNHALSLMKRYGLSDFDRAYIYEKQRFQTS